MAEVKLRALGLREVDFGDYDRYLTALTLNGRKIEILCKGVKRGRRQNPAARQFCWSEFILMERGGKYSLRDADLVHSFFGLTGDIEKYALACYLSELAGSVTNAEMDSPSMCLLLLYALRSLERGNRDAGLVKAAFEWRTMGEAGYAPEFSSCGVCSGEISSTPKYFSVQAGQVAHEKCAERVSGWERLSEAAYRALVYSENSTPEKVYSFSLTGPARNQFCGMAERYVQYHLERSFESLEFYKSVMTSF